MVTYFHSKNRLLKGLQREDAIPKVNVFLSHRLRSEQRKDSIISKRIKASLRSFLSRWVESAEKFECRRGAFRLHSLNTAAFYKERFESLRRGEGFRRFQLSVESNQTITLNLVLLRFEIS